MTLFRSLLLAATLLSATPAIAQAPAGDSTWLYRGSDIAPDPAWRFGTLPNGVRYAVRRNPLPAGQVSVRVRIDAGALHEEDNERGWAHFLEHMLFRGTATFPDRQARHIWQQLGASFGSDTNATTTPTNTVYQLDLPRNDRPSLDQGLHVLSEMMSAARIETAAVDAERPVVQAERERRPELSTRISEQVFPLHYAGLRFRDRETIGTPETLQGATAEGLRAFYRRWYRPDRATVIMVGDADPAVMEALIRARFGGWQAEGPAPQEPDYGQVAEPQQNAVNVAYPGAPVSANLLWIRPYRAVPHTMAREQQFLAEMLAERIINRRLEAHARRESAFIGAGIDSGRMRNVAETTSLDISVRGNEWRKAVEESYAIVTDAVRTPPHADEISREISTLLTGTRAAAQADPTTLSNARADQLVRAIDAGAVITATPLALENLERNAPLMTPARVHGAMRAMFEGSGPRTLLISPTPVDGGTAAIAQAVTAASRVAPAVREAGRRVSFDDVPAPRPNGRVASRQRIEDMDTNIVRFANGSTLTHKETAFELGTVHVRFRFGEGQAGLSPNQPSLAWLNGIVGGSGIADLDLDALERLLAGRRLGLSFGIDDNAFSLQGRTTAAELGDQMRLLTAKLTHPRWDENLLTRIRTSAVEAFELHQSSASARASREMGGFLRPGDQRWRPIERAEMEAVTLSDLSRFYDPVLAERPVHVVIVGDVELEAAIEQVRRTVGSLPAAREETPPATNLAVRPPAPNPEPTRFTHQGAPDQAFAVIGWSTFGGTGNTRDRRALAMAGNMFRTRLFDELRETQGASYSPSASHSSSETFANWGAFYAASEVRPEHVPTFLRVARQIVADLAANPVLADEFERAKNPIVSGIERTMASNGFWMSAIEDWPHRPESIVDVRNYLSDYRALTPEDVRAAVARHVTDAGDWSMVVLPARAAPASN